MGVSLRRRGPGTHRPSHRPATSCGWPGLGRHLPRHRHPAAAPLRQGHRPGPAVHDPRPERFRRPAERRPHRAWAWPRPTSGSPKGDLHGHLQPLRQRPAETRPGPGRPLSLVPRLGRGTEAALRRLRRPQGSAAACWTTTTCCSTGTRLLADAQAGDRRPRAVRLRAGRRVPGHQRASGRNPLPALPGGAGTDGGRRRRPVDLLLPRRHGPQHPRLSQALSGSDDRDPGAELPQHAADPRRHQRGDRPGPGALHQESLVEPDRGPAAGPGDAARTRTIRRSSSSGGSSNIARRASTCGGRPCCFARRTTASSWKPNWRGGTSPSTSTAG